MRTHKRPARPYGVHDGPRFEAWFRAMCEDEREHRLWQGATDARGYGVLHHRGRTTRAHRVAYELARGPVPEGMDVCQRPDCPPNCTTPGHLYLNRRLRLAGKHTAQDDEPCTYLP
jgi:hypothetical protein